MHFHFNHSKVEVSGRQNQKSFVDSLADLGDNSDFAFNCWIRTVESLLVVLLGGLNSRTTMSGRNKMICRQNVKTELDLQFLAYSS